jgi:hypothetical protein
MERYTINISFNNQIFEKTSNIVEEVRTLKEAMSYVDLMYSAVKKSLIKVG